jgi:hypothetical protein
MTHSNAVGNFVPRFLSSKGRNIFQNCRSIQIARQPWQILLDKLKMLSSFGYVTLKHTEFQDPASWYNVTMASITAFT